MNVTRYLKEADLSMAQELDLVSEDPEKFVSDFVDEVNYEFDDFSALRKGFKNSTRNLKFLRENQRIPFYFSILYATNYHLAE